MLCAKHRLCALPCVYILFLHRLSPVQLVSKTMEWNRLETCYNYFFIVQEDSKAKIKTPAGSMSMRALVYKLHLLGASSHGRSGSTTTSSPPRASHLLIPSPEIVSGLDCHRILACRLWEHRNIQTSSCLLVEGFEKLLIAWSLVSSSPVGLTLS